MTIDDIKTLVAADESRTLELKKGCDTLVELRQSIISEVVTGKRKVYERDE